MKRLKILNELDALVDVGGVYDSSRDRYDHHQKGFNEVFGHGFTTKLSSAGLVYKVPYYFQIIFNFSQIILLVLKRFNICLQLNK